MNSCQQSEFFLKKKRTKNTKAKYTKRSFVLLAPFFSCQKKKLKITSQQPILIGRVGSKKKNTKDKRQLHAVGIGGYLQVISRPFQLPTSTEEKLFFAWSFLSFLVSNHFLSIMHVFNDFVHLCFTDFQ